MKIVFIPGICYLADPIFTTLLEHLEGHELIYLKNSDDHSVLNGLSKETFDENMIKTKFSKLYYWGKFENYKNIDNSRYIKKLAIYRRFRDSMIKKLDEINPDIIISTSDMLFSQKVAIDWGKKNRIEYVIIQSAFFENDFRKQKLIKRIKYIYINKILKIPVMRRGFVIGNEDKHTHLILWGDYFKNGFKKENIHILGNPLQTHVNKQINILSDSVLICSDEMNTLKSVIGNVSFSRIIDIYREVINHSNLQFILRPHPGDDLPYLKSLFSGINNLTINTEETLEELLDSSFVQVSVNSASSFYAVINNTPIILLQPFTKSNMSDIFNNEIELIVKNVEEFNKALHTVRNNEFLQNFKVRRELFLNRRSKKTAIDPSVLIANKILKLGETRSLRNTN